MRKNARLRAKESTMPVRAVLLGLGLIMVVLGLVSTSLPVHRVTPVVVKAEHSIKAAQKMAVPIAPAVPVVQAVPAAPPVKFDFYNTLSTEKVSSAASSAPQKPATGQYIDQIALFGERDLADKFLQSLQLKGFNAQVVEIPVSASNETAKYRVILGPFASEEEAKVAQANLKLANVDSSVKQET